MRGLTLSRAAAGLWRALLAKSEIGREQLLIVNCLSTDWQSLTFIGERHELELRVLPPGAEAMADRLAASLPDLELPMTGQLVADIAPQGPAVLHGDGSVSLFIEALTLVT